MALPVFKITDAGIAAANAHAGGPAIFITKFKIGSGVNYTPVGGDTDIHGTMLYEGAPTSLNLVSNQVLDVVVQIPASVGPFNFGEIGLFLDDNTMFAIAAYDVLQEKLQQVVNGIANVWVIHCLLHLSPTPNVSFTLQNNSGVILPEVPNTGYVTGPVQMMNDPNAVIVHEHTPGNESMFLVKHGDYEWVPDEYYFWKSGTVTAATYSDVTAAVFGGIGNYHENALLIQDTHGNVRGISAISHKKATYTHPSIQLSVGNTFKLYKYSNLAQLGLDFTEGNPEPGDTFTILTPSITSPAEGTTGVGRNSFTITTSAFATDPAASDTWGGTSAEIITSTGGAITGFNLMMGNQTTFTATFTTPLAANTQYKLRIKHVGTSGQSSAWSAYNTFTTAGGVVVAINPPTTNAAGNTAIAFTISATPNPMTVSNGSDNHAQTEFRITTAPNGGGSLAFTTQTGAGAYSAQVTGLLNGTTYYAAARYRGNSLGWSAWGADAAFTTLSTAGGVSPTAYVDAPNSTGATSGVDATQAYPITFTNAGSAVHNSTATVNNLGIEVYEGANLVQTFTIAATSPASIPSNTMAPGKSYSIKTRYFTTQGGLFSDYTTMSVSTSGSQAYDPIIHFGNGIVIQQGNDFSYWITGGPPGTTATITWDSPAPNDLNQNPYILNIDGSGNYGSSLSPEVIHTLRTEPSDFGFMANVAFSGGITRRFGYRITHCPIASVNYDASSVAARGRCNLVITFDPSITNHGGKLDHSPLYKIELNTGNASIVGYSPIPSGFHHWYGSAYNSATGVLTLTVVADDVASNQNITFTVTDAQGHTFTRSIPVTVTSTIPVTQPHGTITFNANGSWTVPAGVTSIYISGFAAGGGGAAGDPWGGGHFNNPMGGAGGGGGEYITSLSRTVSPGDIIGITVGAPGAGGVYSGYYGTSGGDGGDTSTTHNGNLIGILKGGKGGQGGNGYYYSTNVGGAKGGIVGSPTDGGSVAYGSGYGGKGGYPNGGIGGDFGSPSEIGSYCEGGGGWVKIDW